MIEGEGSMSLLVGWMQRDDQKITIITTLTLLRWHKSFPSTPDLMRLCTKASKSFLKYFPICYLSIISEILNNSFIHFFFISYCRIFTFPSFLIPSSLIYLKLHLREHTFLQEHGNSMKDMNAHDYISYVGYEPFLHNTEWSGFHRTTYDTKANKIMKW